MVIGEVVRQVGESGKMWGRFLNVLKLRPIKFLAAPHQASPAHLEVNSLMPMILGVGVGHHPENHQQSSVVAKEQGSHMVTNKTTNHKVQS